MSLPNPFLIITLSDATDRQPRSLSVRCSHGQSTLPLPSTPNPPAERAATALVVLQHYSATGCACTVPAPEAGAGS